MSTPPRDQSRHLRPVDTDEPDTGDLARTPPQDIQAEQAVLGGMLLSRQALTDVLLTGLDAADFYRPAHETIYDTVLTLHGTGQPVDGITVADHLTKTGSLNRVGGRAYLHDLTLAVPTAANAAHHAGIVREKAVLRRLVEAGTRVVQLGYTATGDLDQVLEEARNGLAAVIHTNTTAGPSAWQPVDLTDILNGTHDDGPTPTILARRDGGCLLYPGAVHSVSGEPGCGKTWAAIVAAAQQLDAGHDVAYLDFEDRPGTLVARLRALGTPDPAIAAHLRYIRPDTAIDTTTRGHLEQAVAGTTLVIVDGITEAMTLHGLSLMDNEDVARWLALIPHRLADLGPAVLQIDHVVKNADNRGRYAIGGQHKLAGITGVAYKMLTIKSFGRGTKGTARLVVDKDRHGHVGPNGATVAELTLDATAEDGRLYAWLDTPGDDHAPDGSWRPTGYMEKVSRHLEVNPGATGRAISEVVRGKAEHVRTALQALINEGYVRTEDGARRAVMHYSIKPFREDEDGTP